MNITPDPFYVSLLRDFQVPSEGPREEEVRAALARLLATKALTLSEIQISRDLARFRGGDLAPAFHLLVATLFLARHAGNTFLRVEKAHALLEKAAWQESDDAETNEAHAVFLIDLWEEIVANDLAALAGGLVLDGPEGFPGALFFQKDYLAVQALNEAFSMLVSSRTQVAPVAQEHLAAALRFSSFTLEGEQAAAVQAATSRRFTVITGGPGTGKTTIVCSILRALLASGQVEAAGIALAAPTGRAAQRLGEAVYEQATQAVNLSADELEALRSLQGSTIHALLGGYAPDFRHDQENPLPQKVVVVDEVSMVDVALMNALLKALPEDARLILLGDPNQLPSVGSGAVLGDLTAAADAPFIARLKVARRYDKKLGYYAEAMNDGDAAKVIDTESLVPYTSAEKGFFRIPGTDASARAALMDWVDDFHLFDKRAGLKALAEKATATDSLADKLLAGEKTEEAGKLFEFLDRSRILSVLHGGPLGVDRVNAMLLARHAARARFETAIHYPGVPIIVTRNAKDRGLFNGDVGVTVKLRDEPYVIFPRGKAVIACPGVLLPEHDLAYAITIHKSQGSQYGNVLVILPDDANCPLLSRQLVYTGITRAKNRAVVLGPDAILAAALARHETRDTGVRIESADS